MADYNQLVKEYRKLAKKADQRLVRLEAYQHDKGFKTATQWAYKRAMNDIKQWSGQDAKRFNTKPPTSVAQLQAKINDIKTFLEKPSSTKKGIIDIYKKKADTINEKYGTDFNWQDLAEYYMSGTADKMDSKFGSKTSLKAIAEVQKLDDETIEEIKKSKDKIKIVEDNVLNDTINRLLKDSSIDKSMLY